MGAARWMLVAAGGLAGAAPPALAVDCIKATTQVELTQCAEQEFHKADTALNAAYRELLRKHPGDEGFASRARDTQRAWVAYRDSDCRLRVGAPGSRGSSESMMILGCQQALTEERTRDLNGMVNCRADDPMCPP